MTAETLLFFSANRELRPHASRVAETGQISDRLLEEVRWLQEAPIDDSGL